MTDDDRDRIPGPSDDGVRREPSPAPDEEATRHSGAPPEAAHDAPTMGAARAGASRSSAASAAIPDSIGEYRILGKLGEGGMGVVYEAEQRDPRRVVALKVIRGGAFVDDDRVRMFQREVETLARLTHPNIGAIYESGRTEDGQHFFAMELVRGSTLSAHLATRPPVTAPGELEQRLRLFAKLASAVHHAHQRGVIHRDLKPSNIIVMEDTEARAAGAQSATRTVTPELKILDFGLARITDDDVRAASMITEVGVIKGTLPYMSPEQARGDGNAIDVRTDVYALGIILYEMIAGQRPYDVLKASLIEAVRVICEEPPRSVALSWGGSRRLDPDVETIIGKALEKEPDRRYASAAALADDVSRFLDSEPIQARPPSAAYQVRKFAKRHRPIVAGAGVAVASLVVGVIVSTALYVRAERAAERARVEARTAQQVGKFLQDTLLGAGPAVAQGRDATILFDILDRTSERIEKELIDDPEIEAHLRSTLGVVYAELNRFDQAASQGQRALEIYLKLFGEENKDVAQTYSNLGLLEGRRGNHAESEKLAIKAVEIARIVHGPEDPKTGVFMQFMGNALTEAGRYKEALTYLEPALAIMRNTPGADPLVLGTAINSVGLAHHYLNEFDAAQAHYEEALDVHKRALGDAHPYVATDLMNLAHLAKSRGQMDDAEARFRETLAIQRKIYPDGDGVMISALDGLASVLKWAGQYDESQALTMEALEMSTRIFGPESDPVARQYNGLGTLLEAKGDPKGALDAYRTSLAINRKIYPPEHQQIATGLNNVGTALGRFGQEDEGLAMLREAIAISERALGPDSSQTTINLNNLGRLLRSAGSHEAALETFREVLTRRLRSVGEQNISTAVTRNDIALTLLEVDRAPEAIDESTKAVDTARAMLGPDHNATTSFEIALASALGQGGRLDDAETLLRACLERQIAAAGDASERAASVRAALAETLAAKEQRAEAEALYQSVLALPPTVLSDSRRLSTMLSYGEQLTEWARFTEAREVLEKCHAGRAAAQGERASTTREAARALAVLYETWERAAPGAGHRTRAAEWRARSAR